MKKLSILLILFFLYSSTKQSFGASQIQPNIDNKIIIKLGHDWLNVPNPNGYIFDIKIFITNEFIPTVKIDNISLKELYDGKLIDLPDFVDEIKLNSKYEEKGEVGIRAQQVNSFAPKPNNIYVVYYVPTNAPADLQHVNKHSTKGLEDFFKVITEESIEDYRKKMVSKVLQGISSADKESWPKTPPGLIPIMADYAVDECGNL